jgi:hypothetical protein
MRARYPSKPIMINRGSEIWQALAPYVSHILLESIYTDFDFDSQKAHIRPFAAYQETLTKIAALRATHPYLQFFSVDYWDMQDKAGVQHIYDTQRSHGIIPYVSRPMLDALYSPPTGFVHRYFEVKDL